MSLANARGMHRWLVLALACDPRPLPAGALADVPPAPGLRACPGLTQPCAVGDTCGDSRQLCFCDSLGGTRGDWYCRSRQCPDRFVGEGEACTMAGLHCEYSLEYACNCIAPEMRWACSMGETCGKLSQGMPCYADQPSVLMGCWFSDCPVQGHCYCWSDHWSCDDGAC